MHEHHPHHRFTPGPWNRPWPPDITPTIALGEGGLTMGAGTRLVRMAAGGRLALDADRERLLALLSIATNRAIPPAVLTSIEAAAGHWHRGDKALANLRLIFANLPRLGDPGDARRLQQAAALLDGGMTPRALLKALDRDGMDFTHGHYDPDQPRVPARSGRESGRWGWRRRGRGALERRGGRHDADRAAQAKRPRASGQNRAGRHRRSLQTGRHGDHSAHRRRPA